MGLSDGSAPDLVRMGARSSTLEDKVNEILSRSRCSHRAFPNLTVTSGRSPTLWVSLQPELQELSKTSALSLPASSQSRLEPLLHQVSLDLVRNLGLCLVAPATGSRDPGSIDENKSTRRKLDTSPDDENLRSAVLLRFPCAQSRRRFRLARHRHFRISERLGGQMQERQQVDPNCLFHESHVPAIRGTTQKRWPSVFSRQCLLHRDSHHLCPPIQIGGSSQCRALIAQLWKALDNRLRAEFIDNDRRCPVL